MEDKPPTNREQMVRMLMKLCMTCKRRLGLECQMFSYCPLHMYCSENCRDSDAQLHDIYCKFTNPTKRPREGSNTRASTTTGASPGQAQSGAETSTGNVKEWEKQTSQIGATGTTGNVPGQRSEGVTSSTTTSKSSNVPPTKKLPTKVDNLNSGTVTRNKTSSRKQASQLGEEESEASMSRQISKALSSSTTSTTVSNDAPRPPKTKSPKEDESKSFGKGWWKGSLVSRKTVETTSSAEAKKESNQSGVSWWTRRPGAKNTPTRSDCSEAPASRTDAPVQKLADTSTNTSSKLTPTSSETTLSSSTKPSTDTRNRTSPAIPHSRSVSSTTMSETVVKSSSVPVSEFTSHVIASITESAISKSSTSASAAEPIGTRASDMFETSVPTSVSETSHNNSSSIKDYLTTLRSTSVSVTETHRSVSDVSHFRDCMEESTSDTQDAISTHAGQTDRHIETDCFTQEPSGLSFSISAPALESLEHSSIAVTTAVSTQALHNAVIVKLNTSTATNVSVELRDMDPFTNIMPLSLNDNTPQPFPTVVGVPLSPPIVFALSPNVIVSLMIRELYLSVGMNTPIVVSANSPVNVQLARSRRPEFLWFRPLPSSSNSSDANVVRRSPVRSQSGCLVIIISSSPSAGANRLTRSAHAISRLSFRTPLVSPFLTNGIILLTTPSSTSNSSEISLHLSPAMTPIYPIINSPITCPDFRFITEISLPVSTAGILDLMHLYGDNSAWFGSSSGTVTKIGPSSVSNVSSCSSGRAVTNLTFCTSNSPIVTPRTDPTTATTDAESQSTTDNADNAVAHDLTHSVTDVTDLVKDLAEDVIETVTTTAAAASSGADAVQATSYNIQTPSTSSKLSRRDKNHKSNVGLNLLARLLNVTTATMDNLKLSPVREDATTATGNEASGACSPSKRRKTKQSSKGCASIPGVSSKSRRTSKNVVDAGADAARESRTRSESSNRECSIPEATDSLTPEITTMSYTVDKRSVLGINLISSSSSSRSSPREGSHCPTSLSRSASSSGMDSMEIPSSSMISMSFTKGRINLRIVPSARSTSSSRNSTAPSSSGPSVSASVSNSRTSNPLYLPKSSQSPVPETNQREKSSDQRETYPEASGYGNVDKKKLPPQTSPSAALNQNKTATSRTSTAADPVDHPPELDTTATSDLPGLTLDVPIEFTVNVTDGSLASRSAANSDSAPLYVLDMDSMQVSVTTATGSASLTSASTDTQSISGIPHTRDISLGERYTGTDQTENDGPWVLLDPNCPFQGALTKSPYAERALLGTKTKYKKIKASRAEAKSARQSKESSLEKDCPSLSSANSPIADNDKSPRAKLELVKALSGLNWDYPKRDLTSQPAERDRERGIRARSTDTAAPISQAAAAVIASGARPKTYTTSANSNNAHPSKAKSKKSQPGRSHQTDQTSSVSQQKTPPTAGDHTDSTEPKKIPVLLGCDSQAGTSQGEANIPTKASNSPSSGVKPKKVTFGRVHDEPPPLPPSRPRSPTLSTSAFPSSSSTQSLSRDSAQASHSDARPKSNDLAGKQHCTHWHRPPGPLTDLDVIVQQTFIRYLRYKQAKAERDQQQRTGPPEHFLHPPPLEEFFTSNFDPDRDINHFKIYQPTPSSPPCPYLVGILEKDHDVSFKRSIFMLMALSKAKLHSTDPLSVGQEAASQMSASENSQYQSATNRESANKTATTQESADQTSKSQDTASQPTGPDSMSQVTKNKGSANQDAENKDPANQSVKDKDPTNQGGTGQDSASQGGVGQASPELASDNTSGAHAGTETQQKGKARKRSRGKRKKKGKKTAAAPGEADKYPNESESKSTGIEKAEIEEFLTENVNEQDKTQDQVDSGEITNQSRGVESAPPSTSQEMHGSSNQGAVGGAQAELRFHSEEFWTILERFYSEIWRNPERAEQAYTSLHQISEAYWDNLETFLNQTALPDEREDTLRRLVQARNHGCPEVVRSEHDRGREVDVAFRPVGEHAVTAGSGRPFSITVRITGMASELWNSVIVEDVHGVLQRVVFSDQLLADQSISMLHFRPGHYLILRNVTLSLDENLHPTVFVDNENKYFLIDPEDLGEEEKDYLF